MIQMEIHVHQFYMNGSKRKILKGMDQYFGSDQIIGVKLGFPTWGVPRPGDPRPGSEITVALCPSQGLITDLFRVK